MKAISVRQPWAHMIMCGTKQYEYRTWSTDHRGDLLICSSANPKIDGTIPGHDLCVVEVTDVEITRFNYRQLGLCLPPRYGKREFAWKLESLKLIKPFPVKGKLNFYYVDDNQIQIIAEVKDLSRNKFETFYKEHIEPLLYKKRK